MKRAVWVAAVVGMVAVGALRAAGDSGFWRRYLAAVSPPGAESAVAVIHPRLRVPGAEADLPRASAESELVAPEALQQATDTARAQGAQALLVHRHGHRVHEYFAVGRDGATLISGGELSPAVFALALGPLVDTRRVQPGTAVAALREAAEVPVGWRNPWSAAARQRFTLAAPPALLLQDLDGTLVTTLAARLWQPLRAGDAWLWGEDDSRLRVDCCIAARLNDWMRLGDLLLQQGNYQGERIVSPDWIRHLLAADAEGRSHPVWLLNQQAATGDEPPAAREVFWFDLAPDMRLWLMPRRSLAVLHWADAGDARDTLIPNIILRGLLDQAPAVGDGTSLHEMVPGH